MGRAQRREEGGLEKLEVEPPPPPASPPVRCERQNINTNGNCNITDTLLTHTQISAPRTRTPSRVAGHTPLVPPHSPFPF